MSQKEGQGLQGGEPASPHSPFRRQEAEEKKAKEQRELSSSPTSIRVSSPPPPLPPTPLLDLRGTPCPINFVRTKLKLEQMPSGEVLEVWLDPGEPIEQVPDSLKMEGYKIESVENRIDFFSLKVYRPVVL